MENDGRQREKLLVQWTTADRRICSGRSSGSLLVYYYIRLLPNYAASTTAVAVRMMVMSITIMITENIEKSKEKLTEQ